MNEGHTDELLMMLVITYGEKLPIPQDMYTEFDDEAVGAFITQEKERFGYGSVTTAARHYYGVDGTLNAKGKQRLEQIAKEK